MRQHHPAEIARTAERPDDELDLLADLPDTGDNLAEAGHRIWGWLADPDHRTLLRLWAEAYARSLVDPTGPWVGFAERTVRDWLTTLGERQAPGHRDTPAGEQERTAVLAVLRGALLDLLATGDRDRTTAAVHAQLGVTARA